MKRPLGFSTNCFSQSMVPYDERIRVGKELGSVNDDLRFDEALTAVRQGLADDFAWVSLHGPGSTTALSNDKVSHEILDAIEAIHRVRPLDIVVLHPDSITDESMFDGYSFPIGIENMDRRKASFQRPDTLRSLLERHPRWQIIVDVNHCYTNDPTLQLVKELFTQFHGRIAEIHVSGYQKSHEPLFKTQQRAILRALPHEDIPIIIESELSDAEDARREHRYIFQSLKQR